MKKLLISSLNSIDGVDHSFEISDEYIEEVNPIFASDIDDIKLMIPTEDGRKVSIELDGFFSINPEIKEKEVITLVKDHTLKI